MSEEEAEWLPFFIDPPPSEALKKSATRQRTPKGSDAASAESVKHRAMNNSDEETTEAENASPRPLEEGYDYYLENGLMVFTAEFLKETRLLLRKRLSSLSIWV